MTTTEDRNDPAALAGEPLPTDLDPPARSEPRAPAPRRGRSLVTPSLLDFLR